MYNNYLKVSECLSLMRQFDVKMSEAAFRQAIRKGQISNTIRASKKEGIDVPMPSLMNFMLSKISGNHDAYELGKFYMEWKFKAQPLPDGRIGKLESFIANSIGDNEYIYIGQFGNLTAYKAMNLCIDYENYTIHLLDDGELGGISSINLISSLVVADIWQKLGVTPNDDVLSKTCVNIYFRTNDRYSHIQGFYLSKNIGFGTPREPLYEKYAKLIRKDAV